MGWQARINRAQQRYENATPEKRNEMRQEWIRKIHKQSRRGPTYPVFKWDTTQGWIVTRRKQLLKKGRKP